MRTFSLSLFALLIALTAAAQPVDYIVRSIDYKTPVTAVSVSPDSLWILAGFEDGTLRVLSAATIKESMRAHEDITLAVAFSPDGRQIASGSNDKTVLLWDLESLEVTGKLQGHSGNIYDVEFSPDGQLVAAASQDKSVRIWNIAENKLVHLLKGHQDMVLEIEFSPDGRYLLSASFDQAIKLWDVETGEQLYAYLENGGSIPDIAFLPGGKSFISAGMDGRLTTWELHPEIFVMKYFGEEYEKELNENPLFLPRQKKEKKSEYQLRLEEAAKVKEKIVQKYYALYMENTGY